MGEKTVWVTLKFLIYCAVMYCDLSSSEKGKKNFFKKISPAGGFWCWFVRFFFLVSSALFIFHLQRA